MGTIQADPSHLGILSFTEDHNNPLMWAHYADEHRGMVIEFDFTQPFFMGSIKKREQTLTQQGRGQREPPPDPAATPMV